MSAERTFEDEPKGFAGLAAAIGESAAERLCAARAGRTVYIPVSGAGVLGAILTADEVDRMRHAFGAGSYAVPMGPFSAREAARRRGRALLSQGWSVAEVAREIGVHPSTVKRWR